MAFLKNSMFRLISVKIEYKIRWLNKKSIGSGTQIMAGGKENQRVAVISQRPDPSALGSQR
jgi:hypothetical protein